jgi:hypothetical protein
MPWIDNDVVQDASRPAERDVVVALDCGVSVADHVPVVVGDEDEDVRVFELRPQEGRVVNRSPVPRGQEAPRVELVMRFDEALATLGPVISLLMFAASLRALTSLAGAEVDVSAIARFI